MQIVIRWADGESTEFIDFDLDNLTGNGVEAVNQTKEWWRERNIFVHWNVECRLEQFVGGHQIVVTYERDGQEDEHVIRLLEEEDYRCYSGECRIFVTQDPCTNRVISPGQLEWEPEHPDQGISELQWRIIDGQRPMQDQVQREREWRLRGEILDEDGKCVISKERTPGVLDAAHVIPVAEGGEDSIKNAIILRTDIHRLYDRGMFFINPKDGKISKSRMSMHLSREYKKLLRNAKLPERTLNRVQEALQERWNNRHPDTERT